MDTSDIKTKAERLAEGIRILKKLEEVGICSLDTGQKEVQAIISNWVKYGLPIHEKVLIPRHQRVADITLPVKKSETAVLILRAQ